MENFTSNSEQETKKFGEKLASQLQPGYIIALYGQLGSGKTAFVKGLAVGLGYSGKVTSPTFIFVKPYHISKQRAVSGERFSRRKIKTLYHIDLYRVENKTDLETIGLGDTLTEPQTASVIEWADRMADLLPRKALKIKFETIGENKRKISLFD